MLNLQTSAGVYPKFNTKQHNDDSQSIIFFMPLIHKHPTGMIVHSWIILSRGRGKGGYKNGTVVRQVTFMPIALDLKRIEVYVKGFIEPEDTPTSYIWWERNRGKSQDRTIGVVFLEKQKKERGKLGNTSQDT